MNELTVSDWENEGKERKIILDPSKEPKKELEKRFKISRKLKKGLPYTKSRIEAAKEELTHWETLYQNFREAAANQTLEPFLYLLEKPPLPSKEPQKKELPYREFKSKAGLTIWVGKNAKGNDKLTFHYAKGSDWWFHVSGFSGSHVILKVGKNQEPDQESIQEAVFLAVEYSKAKDKRGVEVYATQCKYVSRLKGQPGKVQISKHRLLSRF